MNGLILAGGNSSRMGEDKAMISYHGCPQYLYLKSLLEKRCKKVYISSANKTYDQINHIYDIEKYSHHGPISGILSAFELEKTDWLVLGIDYPWIELSDIDLLIQSKHPIASANYNPITAFYEPTLGIYRSECSDLLKENMIAENYSLQQFLNRVKAEKIIPNDLRKIKSIDTIDEKYTTIQLLNQFF